MFDLSFTAKISSIHPRVLVDDETARRITEFTVQAELDDDLAAGMGEAGQSALEHLRAGAIKSSVVILDALQIRAAFDAGNKDKHKLDIVGISARLLAPRKEGTGPVAKIKAAFPTRHADLLWFVDHLEQSIEVKMIKVQTELAGVK